MCGTRRRGRRWGAALEKERYVVDPWFSSPTVEPAVGRALVLPGGGYTVDHPGADHLDAKAGPASKTLILAKSLGSYATAWASNRRYPAIWLTPVLTDDFVAEALARYSAAALLVGGTRDSLWDSAATNLQCFGDSQC
jgi:hypothetical protein